MLKIIKSNVIFSSIVVFLFIFLIHGQYFSNQNTVVIIREGSRPNSTTTESTGYEEKYVFNVKKLAKPNNEILPKLNKNPLPKKSITHHNKDKKKKDNKEKLLLTRFNEPPSNASILQKIDFSKYPDEDREFLEKMAPRYIDRAKTIFEVCSNNPQTKTTVKSSYIFEKDHSPSLVWCPIPKVASGSWSINFLKLHHFNDDNPDILKMSEDKRKELQYSPMYGATQNKVRTMLAPPDDPVERLRIFRSSLKFIIVRHPLVRLLSAYRDKMAKYNPRPERFHFDILQKKIIKKYRSKGSKIISDFPTFPEFLDYIIDSTKNLKTALEWRRKVKCWLPYWVHCDVCSSDYNIVMKLETMREDERFIITISRLEELQKEREWRHIRNVTSYQMSNEYFSQLKKSQVKLIYERYKLDFQLFGYDVVDYLLVAQPG